MTLPRDPIAALANPDPADRELILAASEAIRARYRYGAHTVAASLRTRHGRIFTAVNLDTTVGRLSICAEAIAIGQAAMENDTSIETIVAVRHPRPGETPTDIAVVSPCGGCRELICDYDRAARVILPGGLALPIAELLPAPYRR